MKEPVLIDDSDSEDKEVQDDRWHWDSSGSRHSQPCPSPSSASTRGRVLYLFSGPAGRSDGVAAYLAAVGIKVDEYDTLNKHMADQDLLDDTVWLKIKARLQAGYYVFLLASPPCRSFSAARSAGPGPPVLRDSEHIYVFPKSQRWRKLEHCHYERIREDNLFAERTAEACAIMDTWGRPYAVEQPEPWGGSVTMFDFESFKALRVNGAKVVAFDQCPFGAPCKKPTLVLYKGGDFNTFQARCDDPAVQQWRDDGSTYWAPHPSFHGKKDRNGGYLTSSLSAYPAKLNCKLATIINKAITEQQDTS